MNNEARASSEARALRERRIAHVSLDVDEEHIVPFALARGPRFDARHVDAVLRERLQQPEQRAGIVGAARRHQQRRAVGAARRKQLAADDEEPGGVVGMVLDLLGEEIEPVDLRRGAARDRRRTPLVAGAACTLRVARDGDTLGLGQVLVQPAAALRERLGVRAHALDVAERAHPPHEVMLDSQLHLAADLERRAQEHVERVAHRALARILDRHHAEVRDPALHFAKHLVDRRQRQAHAPRIRSA